METTLVELNAMALFLEKDEFIKAKVLEKIKACINKSDIPRIVTSETIFSLCLESEEKIKIKNLSFKNEEIILSFFKKNQIFNNEGDITFIKSLDYINNLQSNFKNVLSDRYGKEISIKILSFLKEEIFVLQRKAESAKKIRENYLKKENLKEVELLILKALEMAPLGSDIMLLILRDLFQSEIGIGGKIGNHISSETLEEIKYQNSFDIKAENKISPTPVW